MQVMGSPPHVFVSPGTRSLLKLAKATKRPLPDTETRPSAPAPSDSPPLAGRLTSVVVLALRSRTKTSGVPLKSLNVPPIGPAFTKTTMLPSREMSAPGNVRASPSSRLSESTLASDVACEPDSASDVRKKTRPSEIASGWPSTSGAGSIARGGRTSPLRSPLPSVKTRRMASARSPSPFSSQTFSPTSSSRNAATSPSKATAGSWKPL